MKRCKHCQTKLSVNISEDGELTYRCPNRRCNYKSSEDAKKDSDYRVASRAFNKYTRRS